MRLLLSVRSSGSLAKIVTIQAAAAGQSAAIEVTIVVS